LNIPIRKKWGQNFLIDPNIINKILKVLNPKENSYVLEIGPGKGALTIPLSKMNINVCAVEIDPMLCNYLNEKKLSNVKLVNSDILKYDTSKLPNDYLIIGNLPYNISSPIIFKFMQSTGWSKMIIMLQKEVAERIVADKNSKKYGRISVMMQSFFNINLEFNVPKTVFSPQPKIKSSIINIEPKAKMDLNYNDMKIVVQNAFKHRRKKLSHNLKKVIKEKYLKNIKDKRAEDLSVEDYQMLSKNLI
tara:strand:+ start:844 stop:1584 length:741 start_codon:yes stop_codon:yes gene_type:complete